VIVEFFLLIIELGLLRASVLEIINFPPAKGSWINNLVHTSSTFSLDEGLAVRFWVSNRGGCLKNSQMSGFKTNKPYYLPHTSSRQQKYYLNLNKDYQLTTLA
jgi:hypothetical protein